MAGILRCLSPSLSFFWLYLYFSLSASLSLVELVPSFFHFLTVLFYHSILLFFTPSLCLWFPQACGKISFSETAPIRTFKHLNMLVKVLFECPHCHRYFIYCMWMNTRYSETIKCFLHCATYLKRNKQTEKNYF